MDQRWSSRVGPVGGQPNVFVSPILGMDGLAQIERVLVYSDGLASLDENRDVLPDQALQALIMQAGQQAASDDIVLLDVWLGNPEEAPF